MIADNVVLTICLSLSPGPNLAASGNTSRSASLPPTRIGERNVNGLKSLELGVDQHVDLFRREVHLTLAGDLGIGRVHDQRIDVHACVFGVELGKRATDLDRPSSTPLLSS